MRAPAGRFGRSLLRPLAPAGLLAGLCVSLAACATGLVAHEPAAVAPPVRERSASAPPPVRPPAEPASPGVTRVPVTQLKGWTADDHRAALAAFRVGCRAAHDPALRRACQAAAQLSAPDSLSARRFFERHFEAEILPGEGVLTGYFAPVYPASHHRSGAFTAPVRPPPAPGQMIDVRMTIAQSAPPPPLRPSPAPAEGADADARTGLATAAAVPPTVSASLNLSALEQASADPVADLLDGPAAGAPVTSATPVDPSPPDVPPVSSSAAVPDDPPPQILRVRMRDADRATIDRAPAEGITAWMRPEDLFFMQIQGSGILVFPDGDRVRAAYAGDNGKPFVGIARPMIRDGLLPSTGASGDGIRRWLAAHAGDVADAVMQKNPRYVFFRIGTDNGAEPQGAAGIPLPAGRAIAMDSSHHDFGSLYWIDAEAPTLTGATAQYHRLAVDLDTGGAIRGPIRADLYFGTGDEAGREAGRVKHVLHLARLVPVDGDLSEERDAAAASPRGR